MAAGDRADLSAISDKKIEEAVLALLYIYSVEERAARWSWKTYDWDVTQRLFEQGFIDNPRGTRKSVLLTPEEKKVGKALAEKLFGDTAQ
jgi:hypothetical protein